MVQLLIVACVNEANELISTGLLNESWHGSTANVLVSNEFDDRSERSKRRFYAAFLGVYYLQL